MPVISSDAQMLPSTRRPIPLECRPDLVVERIEYQGVGSYVIKDPVGLKYHRLQPEQYAALNLLDSERSLEDIRDELLRQFPTLHLKPADVQHLITDLHRKGLVYSQRSGQGVELLKQHRESRRKKVFQTFRSLLYLRLPGWDPERALVALYRFPPIRWMFQPWLVAVCMAFVASAWLVLLVNFDSFRGRLPEFHQFFGWPNLIYMWGTLAICKVIHEFGHGLSCKHFGGECHEMGVMLLVFSPCLYCDVSDSWMLRNKWKRIAIAAAGMYIEVILSAVAIYVWWNTVPGLIHHLALNVFFVTTVTTVIFNANPLMRFDGYYMMADWLEIPNLRPKSDKLLRDKFAWYCLGIETRPDPFMPETGIGWFVGYAIAASLYRWFILFGITLFLYTVLKPYGLQSIGIALAVMGVGGIVFNMGYNLYKIISAPRVEPMDYRKVAATLTVVGLLIAGAWTIPLPFMHVEAPFLLEPQGVQHVYTKTEGRIVRIHVKPGDAVKKDQVLAELDNYALEDEYRTLLMEYAIQGQRLRTAEALADPTQESLAGQKLSSILSQLLALEDQRRHLKIVAPQDGFVVAPARAPEPKHDPVRKQLPTWHGTPLDPENVGCFLETGTHMLSVAPDLTNYVAVLYVDQADRNDIAEGLPVELKFEHLPGRTYECAVDVISEREVQFAPEALSNKAGGALPTVTDDDGRERLQSAAYQAIVPLKGDEQLDADVALLKSGLRGDARFLVDHRTAAGWISRWWNQTFRFRL
jgi:putative peptide zinc metalloprotease protein